ncbi:cytochrome P460 family protein [Pokkaliibacter sp. CJK22405]|uniref:cytochrome P460 family protein n=1 Tax=Pokkaliibacter sp. CJK22405 TaxID=3384615 RepID=UPI0039856681
MKEACAMQALFKPHCSFRLGAVVIATVLSVSTVQAETSASENASAAANTQVQFPANPTAGAHYATVTRGSTREELYTSHEAIAAARAGEPLPNGTTIVLEDFRDDTLFRYVIMEKQAGFGEQVPEHQRTGDWLFREFAPDGTPNASVDGSRCMSCHQSQSANDFVFTLDRMKAYSD